MSNFRIFVFIFVAGLAYGKNNKDSKSDTSKSKAIKEIRQDIQIRLSSKLFPSKLKGVVERSSYVIFARRPLHGDRNCQILSENILLFFSLRDFFEL